MGTTILSKIQFAVSAGFHFLFPPLTIGMSWIIFFMLYKYWRTDDPVYEKMSYFWTKLFGISFVVGVVTGIVMEFQFGTNWSEYSRFVGDIFGAPLAAEGVLAFFLESTFIGVLLWGRDKVSKGFYAFSGLMVAVGSTLSALWILIANSWMQTPAGFEVVDGKARLTDFFAAALNPSTVERYLHTIDAAIITGAFFIMGVSAYYLLKDREIEFAKKSLKIALIVALIASIGQFALGHAHSVQVAETQPAKLAAFEGVFETQEGAPLSVFGIPNEEAGKMTFEVGIPKMLSFLVDGDFNSKIQGLNEFAKENWPPVAPVFYSYHIMIALGTFFAFITACGTYRLIRGKLFNNKTILKVLMFSTPLPFIANEFGWVAAEMGRQPWIVYNVLKTNDAISFTVPGVQVFISLAILLVVYAILFFAWLFLIKKKIDEGPEGIMANEKSHEGEVMA